MKEKFEIDRNKLNEIVNQYKKETRRGFGEKRKQEILARYIGVVIDTLGTDVLKEAISSAVLEHLAELILKDNQIHQHYQDEDSLKMIEGLSNYEIVGDWQHFLTVNSQYLFKLPRNMQEMFAENFSIGNQDAKECLLELWGNHIETTGTDVMRETSLRSTNNITIECNASEMHLLSETIR